MATLSSISYSSSQNGYGRNRLTSLNGQPSPGAVPNRSLASALSPQSQAAAAIPQIKSPMIDTGAGVISPPPAAAPAVTQPNTPAPSTPTSQPQTQPQSQSSAVTQTPTLDSDPILAQIRDLANTNDQQARDAATAGKAQLLENYGDAGLANALGLGSNVAGVAGQNPNSILAQLLQTHNQNVGGINQADNKANLYYSSTHAHHLADEGRQYQTGRYNADQNVRGQLAQIDQTLAQALAANQAQRIQGAQDAYGRYVNSNPTVPPDNSTPPPGGDQPPYGGLGSILTAPDYLTALALANGTRRPVAL